jgi:pimeloyl-ACP methyl ester carboxylesterase
MRLRLTLLAASLLLALVLVGPSAASAKVVWLCKPGMRANPCEPSLTTTVFSPSAERIGVRHVRRAHRRRADCFYVYPTVSDQQRPQATQVVDDVLRSSALYQAARYSRDCRVFAPVYRQTTIYGLLHPETVTAKMRATTYADVVEAWRTYLRKLNHGRGVILIGHSQGTFLLSRLVAGEIDPKPAVRKRLISAILLGGNVTVRKGGDRGGDFKHIRACRSRRQVGCVLAFSTFNETPPANAIFGRTTAPGLEVLCTNPAALAGGSAKLSPVYPSKPFAQSVIGAEANAALQGLPRPKTAWATFPESVTGHCSRAGGADVLRVQPLGSSFTLRPLPDSTWGLHLTDANIALGNLADLARHQISLYERR